MVYIISGALIALAFTIGYFVGHSVNVSSELEAFGHVWETEGKIYSKAYNEGVRDTENKYRKYIQYLKGE